MTRDVPSGLAALDPPLAVVTVPVVEARMTHTTDATAAGRYGSPPAVLSSGRAGVVTSVAVQLGALVTTGAEVFRVDDLTIRAYSSDTVFYRPLPPKTSGPDVRAAQELLGVLLPGTRVTVDGVVGASTVAAVKAYERAQGVAAPTGVFDPTWFVRLPSAPYEVGATPLVVGAPAPGLGEPVLSGVTRLVRAELTTATSHPAGPDGAWRLACSGRETTVSRAGDAWAFDDLASLAPLLGPPDGQGATATCQGTLQVATPAPAQGVPPASLVSSRDGSRTCVLTRDGDGTITAVPLPALEPSIDGLVTFAPTLPGGTQVVVNPAEAAPDVPCP